MDTNQSPKDCHRCAGFLEPDGTCANFYCPNFTFTWPMKTTTITHYVELLPITLHPAFNKPRNDWGIREAYMENIYAECDCEDYCYCGNDLIGGIYHPEDRSRWKPEYDGKSMAVFWDADKGEFRKGTPLEYMPTMFLSPACSVETI